MSSFNPNRQWEFKSPQFSKMSMNELYLYNIQRAAQKQWASTKQYVEVELARIENELKYLDLPRQFYFESKLFQVKFDRSKPHIQLESSSTLLNSPNEAELDIELIKELCRLAQKNNLFDDAKSGGHICVEVNKKKNGRSRGYVMLAVDEYYHVNPWRSSFLKNFRKTRKTYSINT
jgi:hypothetical protein